VALSSIAADRAISKSLSVLLTILALFQSAGHAASAVQTPVIRALLVGVSAYPGLPAPDSAGNPRQLLGPRNDVWLMSEVFARLGVLRSQQAILADGAKDSDGLPTRRAIEKGLEKLLGISSPGDVAILYFAGHGSREPSPVSIDHPIGFRDLFLPLDVGRWRDREQAVDNSISDDEFSAWRDAFTKRGVVVWAIFDTCHAGAMFRGVAEEESVPEVSRYYPPGLLGVPLPKSRPPPAPATSFEHRALRSGRWVAFYASQSNETTPELDLPIGGAASKRHGLFTYTVAQALSGRALSSFRDLRNRVLYRYAALGRLAPNPDADGDLDSAIPIKTWGASLATDRYLVHRDGEGWLLEAGQIQGIREAELLRLSAEAESEDSPEFVLGRARQVGNLTSAVEILSLDSTRTAPSCGVLKSLTLATSTAVASRVLWASTCRSADTQIATAPLRHCRFEPNSSAELARCTKISNEESKTTELPMAFRGFMQSTLAGTGREHESEVVVALTPSGVIFFPSITLPGGISLPPLRLKLDQPDFSTVLYAFERKVILLRQLTILAGQSTDSSNAASVIIKAGSGGRSTDCSAATASFDARDTPTLPSGSKMLVQLADQSDEPADMLIIAVGPEGDSTLLFPRPNENNRLLPGSTVSFCNQIDPSGPPGPNWLFAISAPVTFPQSTRLDMDSLYPASYRGRGMSAPSKKNSVLAQASVKIFQWTEVHQVH
jgi:hypothetical protein